MCACSQLCSTLTPWTVARQAPLSMDFSWTVLNCSWTFPEYWSGLPFPTPGSLPTQGSNMFLVSLAHSPQMPLPSRLPHNVEQSSLCYTVGPFLLPILNIAVCTRPSQTLHSIFLKELMWDWILSFHIKNRGLEGRRRERMEQRDLHKISALPLIFRNANFDNT